MNNATATLSAAMQAALDRNVRLGAALFPKDHPFPCSDVNCTDRVVNFEGRFFITGGHAGFNSPANNRDGYRTSAVALTASNRYQNRSKK